MSENEFDLLENQLDGLYNANEISEEIYFLYKTKLIYFRFMKKAFNALLQVKAMREEGGGDIIERK